MSRPPVYSLLGYAVASDFDFLTPMHPVDRAPDLELVVGGAPWTVPATDADADWSSGELLPSGQAIQSVHRLDDDRTLYRFGEVVDFHIEPGRITASILDPAYAYMLEIRFLGPVLAFLRELDGNPVLHGSAVVSGGTAIGFLSGNGGGKTTIAATFLRRGAPLLTDDLLALAPGPDGVTGFPGYPQMRMWPDAAVNFVGSVDRLGIVHPGLDKRRVPVGPDGLGSFHPEPAPVATIYELERDRSGPVDTGDVEVEITDLRGTDAVMTLVRHCFLGSLVHGIGLGGERFARLADVVERVAVRRVVYRAGFDDVDRVCDVLEDVIPR